MFKTYESHGLIVQYQLRWCMYNDSLAACSVHCLSTMVLKVTLYPITIIIILTQVSIIIVK